MNPAEGHRSILPPQQPAMEDGKVDLLWLKKVLYTLSLVMESLICIRCRIIGIF
jgi:hypothetical protein